MAKAGSGSGNNSALAKAEPAALAVVDVLDGILGVDDVETGLSDIDASDVKLAALVLNMKGVDRAGDPIAPNLLFNTVEETTSRSVTVVWLDMKKTRLFSRFDSAKDETVRVCRSFDRETGTMEDGSTRACNGCPEKEWRTIDGKRSRNCSDVWNMFGINSETQMPLVMRFKKTAEPVLKDYLNKHHINRRPVVVNGVKKLADMPLCAYSSEVSAVMDKSGKFALPVLQRGDLLPANEIRMFAEQAKKLRERMEKDLNAVEAVAEKGEGGADGADTSFNTGDFAGNGSNDFVEAQGSAA